MSLPVTARWFINATELFIPSIPFPPPEEKPRVRCVGQEHARLRYRPQIKFPIKISYLA